MAKAKVENYNGSPAIIIDGKVYPPMMATIRMTNVSDMKVDREYYRNLGKSGIKIYFLICDTEWLKPGAYEQFCHEAQILLEEVPDAHIMIRIGMHPPVEWCEQNPDETLTYSDGKKKPAHLYTESFIADYPAIYSLSSQKWREDASKALVKTLERVENSPYGDRVIGCFFAAGGTSEWYYLTPTEYTPKTTYVDSGGWVQTTDTDYDNVYGDLSPAFMREFSEYLKEKYQTDEKLREAWNDETVSIDNPRIADCDARYYIYGVDYDIKYPATTYSMAPQPPMPSNGTNIGHFVDMDRRRDVFDFFRAWHTGTANSVIYFGNVVKSLYPDKLTGAFYGSAGSTKFFGFSQIGAVDKILNSGKIDFLASPGVYENRQPGGFTGQRQNFDSFRLKNTMFIVEDDVRTHLENAQNRGIYEIYDYEDTYKVMKREFGRNICQDTQAWWFDQHVGGGRYKHEKIYELIKKQQEIAARSYEYDRRKNSEIALICDEESYHVISDQSTQQLMEIFRNYEADIVGAPMDRYLHNDMAYENMPDYKLYIFQNTLYLTDDERAIIKKKLSKNNATALFMYGAGVINPDKKPAFSAENIYDLTGIKTEFVDGVYDGKFRVTSGNGIADRLKDDVFYGDFDRKMYYNSSGYIGKVREERDTLCPLLCANDDEAVSAAYFPDSKKSAVSIKKMDGYTSVYCGAKFVNAEFVRAVAAFAGCHIYSDTNDVFYANKNFITFHAASGGEKVIKLPRVASAFEVYEEKYYSDNSNEIRFNIKRGQTLMFELK